MPQQRQASSEDAGTALNSVSFVQTAAAPTSSIDPVNFVHGAVPDGAQSASTIETIPRPETPCSDAEVSVFMVTSRPTIDELFNPEEPPRYLPKPMPKGPPACVLPPWTHSPPRSPPTRPWTPPLRDYYTTATRWTTRRDSSTAMPRLR